MPQHALERRYDGPIPAPFAPVNLERERVELLASADAAEAAATACDNRSVVWSKNGWPSQAVAWSKEAAHHRQTADMLRESAARCAARMHLLMIEASAQRAAE